MKIVHIADVHLGATNRKLSLEQQKYLKSQNANRLKFAFDWSKQIGASAIIISGDLFHSKNPSAQLVKFFVQCVGSVSIPVFYVKGNHDQDFLFSDLQLENFVLLDKFTLKSIENVNICGMSGQPDNLPVLPKDDFNICMLHGDISNPGSDYIDLALCQNKNIDYLALGHLHTFQSGKLDARGIYAYSGCLTSNGFDECGDKGFVLLDTETRQVQFVTIEGNKFCSVDVDLTGFDGYDDLRQRVQKALAGCSEGDFVRINLTGSFEEQQDKFLPMLTNHFAREFAYFEIKDNSSLKVNLEKLATETLSFKAEFLRLVSQDDTLSQQEKTAICEFGINALRGEDL